MTRAPAATAGRDYVIRAPSFTEWISYHHALMTTAPEPEEELAPLPEPPAQAIMPAHGAPCCDYTPED